MSTGPLSCTRRLSLLACACVLFGAVPAVADETAPVFTSEVGRKLAESLRAGVPFAGMSASLDGAQVWPGLLFLRWDGAGPRFDGHIEWTSLQHVNYVEGTFTETGGFVEVDFTATRKLVEGSAAAGVDYHAVAMLRNGELVLLGKWTAGEHRGPFEMTADPARAGQQSSLLQGVSLDEALGDRQRQADAGKPRIVWQDEALDWKIDGFEYPGGNRFVKLSCSWARDRLAEGPSPGEMMIVITTADDSPMLGFRYENHVNWKQHVAELGHIDILFGGDVRYRLPVAPQDNGWVYSTDPALVGRIVRSAGQDARHVDSDMIVATGIAGLLRGSELDAHISTRGLAEAWIAADHFMQGEEPPSILEIMQRD